MIARIVAVNPIMILIDDVKPSRIDGIYSGSIVISITNTPREQTNKRSIIMMYRIIGYSGILNHTTFLNDKEEGDLLRYSLF